VPSEGSFPVEDFITAITSQLDRVQDSLRVKAVNRPLTYALKDLALELKVFVEMDQQGKVRFRTSGPNEAGASTVNLGFTTITKPMIEENTITMAATRSPSLQELGMAPEEQQKLERMGVSNLAQLNRLGSSAGVQTISRLAEVPVDRIKFAISQGQPQLHGVHPDGSHDPTIGGPKSGPIVSVPPRVTPLPSPPIRTTPPPSSGSPAKTPVIRVPIGSRRLNLKGNNLVGEDGPPAVRLNDKSLEVLQAENDHVVVDLPQAESGTLEISLPNGSIESFELSVDQDAWAPGGERT